MMMLSSNKAAVITFNLVRQINVTELKMCKAKTEVFSDDMTLAYHMRLLSFPSNYTITINVLIDNALIVVVVIIKSCLWCV